MSVLNLARRVASHVCSVLTIQGINEYLFGHTYDFGFP